jgi:hypothetical protein
MEVYDPEKLSHLPLPLVDQLLDIFRYLTYASGLLSL